jgi:hypothetical protein
VNNGQVLYYLQLQADLQPRPATVMVVGMAQAGNSLVMLPGIICLPLLVIHDSSSAWIIW